MSTEYSVGTHTQDIYFTSVEKEVAIGRSLAKQAQAQLELSNDPRLLKRLRTLGAKIVEVCDRQEIDYYFYVIDKDEINAFSVPGGYVYCFRGLMDVLNDDELAFVIAHEIGHIVSRHAIKRLQAAMGMNLLVLASSQANTSPDFVQGLSFALGQITAAYSREDELNADELAVKYTSLAGFDPAAGIEVMEKLYEQQRKEPDRPLSYFRTHPYSAQRIRRIKETLGLELDVSDYIN